MSESRQTKETETNAIMPQTLLAQVPSINKFVEVTSSKTLDSEPPTLRTLALSPTPHNVQKAREEDLLLLLPSLFLLAAQRNSLFAVLHGRISSSRQLKLRVLLLRKHPAFKALNVPLNYTSKAYGAYCQLRTAAASSAKLILPREEHSDVTIDGMAPVSRRRKLLVDMVDLQSEDFFSSTAFSRPNSSRWAHRALASQDFSEPAAKDGTTTNSGTTAIDGTFESSSTVDISPVTSVSSSQSAQQKVERAVAARLSRSVPSTNSIVHSQSQFAGSTNTGSASSSNSGSNVSTSLTSLSKSAAALLARALGTEEGATNSVKTKGRGSTIAEETTAVVPRLIVHPFFTSDASDTTSIITSDSDDTVSGDALAHASLLRPILINVAALTPCTAPGGSQCPHSKTTSTATVSSTQSTEPGATDIMLLRLPAEGGPLSDGSPIGDCIHAIPMDGLAHAAASIALRLLSAVWDTSWAEPFAAPFAQVQDVAIIGPARSLVTAPSSMARRCGANPQSPTLPPPPPLHGTFTAANAPQWAASGAELDTFARSAAGALVAGYVFGLRPPGITTAASAVAGSTSGGGGGSGLVVDGRIVVWTRIAGIGDAFGRPCLPHGLKRMFKKLGIWDAFAYNCLRAFRSARESAVEIANVVEPLAVHSGGKVGGLREFVAGRHGVDVSQTDSAKAEVHFRKWLDAKNNW